MKSVASLTEGGRQNGSFFILWELFQCQTPVLSVFSDAESWSVFASEGETGIDAFKFVHK